MTSERAAAQEAQRLQAAIEAHRADWQRYNGTNPNEARPDDLKLWAVLAGETGHAE